MTIFVGEDDSLNLDTLLIQIRGAVTSRWYQLGEALEVSKEVLDKCTNYPPEESIVEILDQWLRNFPGSPTWRAIAVALRKIDLQQLANDIEMVYETGTYISLRYAISPDNVLKRIICMCVYKCVVCIILCVCVHMYACVCAYMTSCVSMCIHVCWPLPSNPSFYRQIASYQRGVGDHRISQ